MEEQEATGNIKEPDTLSTVVLDESKSAITRSSREDTDITLPSHTSKSEQEVTFLERPPAIPKKKFKSAIIPGFPHRLQISHDCLKRTSLQKRVLCHIATTEKPLFATVLNEPEKEEAPSFLVTGCGLRNLASLQEALHLDEHLKLKQLYNAQEREGEYYSTPSTSSSNVIETELTKSDSSGTQTNASLAESDGSKTKRKLLYLMGLHELEEDEEENAEEVEKLPIGLQEPILKTSEAMRNAQRYLRSHNIFKFFEFIIAHMLSALPDNPIEFIIDLLNQCLVFRAGFTEPPLLYNRKHLESLFYLMDKMRTNFIDINQYRTGMHTLGICSYNNNPPLSNEGLVAKEEFIEEAYNQLTDQLNDLLRRRWLHGPPPEIPPPPPTPQISLLGSVSSADLEGSCLQFTKTRLFLDYNPIEFIIDLLNQCLVFRAGFTEPPLLYNRKHLESLFYLMDKMRTNFIDINQYRTGMHTLGICSYNNNPPLSNEGLVAKEEFIEEAYNQLTDQLNDLLRRRWLHGPPPEIPPPPPTPQISLLGSVSSADLEGSCLQFTKTRLFLDCNKTTTNL